MLEVSFHEFDNENPLLTVMFIHITLLDCDQGQSMTRKVCHNSFPVFFFLFQLIQVYGQFRRFSLIPGSLLRSGA